ncbi:inactive tyrosine-protein kinase 7a [Fundulus heteroclitus]|uniref:inactive tyrosine-protein kinase 7a n=1 Tax=Fundulus heteroclitus TaxID=8078 RepID=UPI00165BE73C|nr:inactive tyrosine-protein kinase 7a [Fundulus heteroclitus]
MEAPAWDKTRRRDRGINSRVTRRGTTPLEVLYGAGLLCFQVLSIQAISIQFTKEPKSQDALHGRSAMLRCEVGNPANITYEWYKDDERLENTERRFQEGSNLKFISVDRQLDAGSFYCKALNYGTGEMLTSTEASFNIKWLESGNVTLKEPVPEGEIESSATVVLRCHIDGHPRPTCQWFKDGVKLTESSHQINNKERTLSIQNVTPDDNGLYYCCAKNAAGHVCSSSNYTLTVIERLKFTPTPQQSQCLELDKEITIQCSAKGREPPTIRWTKADGGELPPHVNQWNGYLRFTNVTRSDAGNYICIASNSLQGEIRALVTLTVAVYIRFKVEPENTAVFQGQTAVLHCQASGDPKPHIHWMVKNRPLDLTRDSRIQKMPNGSLIIKEVTTEDTGRYTCVAGNSCSIKDRVAQLYVVDPRRR